MIDISPYLEELLSIAFLQTVAVISPGPDFALILHNSLVHSRRVALLTALGISIGICIHVTYVLAGVGALIASSVWLFHIVKYLGCAYLIYLGFKGMTAQKYEESLDENHEHKPKKRLSGFQAFMFGFITNLLNPKAILFFLSIFTVIIEPSTPLLVQLFSGLLVFLITFSWFSLVVIGFSHHAIRQLFARRKHWVERVTGSLLILMGLKLVTLQ